MTKWADFVVSAIKKGSGIANITHVQIHEDLGNGFGPPELIDKSEISSRIKKGISFITVYKQAENEWVPGEIIRTYAKDGETHIRVDDNKVDSDNLGPTLEVDELELVFKVIKKEEPKIQFHPSKELKHEPEPVLEVTPVVKTPDGDYEYEDEKRAELAKEAEVARSAKSLPKGWSPEKAAAEEKLRLETIEKQKAKQKAREEQEKLEKEQAAIKAKAEQERKQEEERKAQELAKIKAQAAAEAREKAAKETSTIVEKLQKQIDTANASLERLRKENEEIKRVKREAEEKAKAEEKAAKEELERARREQEQAEEKAAKEQLEKELAEAKAAKEEMERQEAAEKAKTNITKTDLAAEIQKELQELREQLQEIDNDDKIDETSQSKIIIDTLKNAVAKGWTKTKTVQELRKSANLTVKNAREYASEIFDTN